MIKAAFAYLEKRIAPVFDTAQQIHLVEVESDHIVNETQEPLASDPALQKALRLTELGVNELICGAISRPLQAMIASYGIQVIPFMAGDLREVIRAWLNGNLKLDTFAMPGCCRRARSRFKGIYDGYQEEKKMNGKGRGGMGSGGGRGQGRGGQGLGGGQVIGRGRRGGLLAAGAGGTCLCPQCGHREPHELGMPCVQKQCPKCGTKLTRA